MEGKSLSVCAVIVTHNRKKLLKRCLDAVFKQSYFVKRIIVVDNQSSDGTNEFLRDLRNENERIDIVELKENLGGAGGFAIGMQHAIRMQPDYMWLMDDDGYPEKNCLFELVRRVNGRNLIGPIVLDETDTHRLSFPYRVKNGAKVINTLEEYQAEEKKKKQQIIFPFNGTLINRYVMEKIGVPKMEFFIWGDEYEYILRAKKAGIGVQTIEEAKYYHPRSGEAIRPMLFKMMRMNNPSSDLKYYCFLRNMLWTYIHYGKFGSAAGLIVKYFWFNFFTDYNATRLKLLLRAIKDGCREDFEYHKRLIGNS